MRVSQWMTALALLTPLLSHSGVYVLSEQYKPEQSEILVRSPNLDTELDIDVGDVITSVSIKNKREFIKLSKNIDRLKGGVLWSIWYISINPQSLPFFASTKNGDKYYAATNINVDYVDKKVKEGGMLIPADKGKPVEVCARTENTVVICEPVAALQFGTDYEVTNIDTLDESSFVKELVYIGGSPSSVTLQYREFKGNVARPAFSQELKYDVSQDNTIGYKGARVVIGKAGNTGLTFKVLKHMN